MQEAEGYRQQAVDRSRGDVAGYEALLAAYRAAPEVTRQRLYLEMMESVLRGNQKVIIDQTGGPGAGQGVVPLLPLNDLVRPRPPAAQGQPQGAAR